MQRGEASLDYFNDSVEQLERKIDSGHPAIAVRTVFGNRIKELASSMTEVISSSSTNYDIRMRTVVNATFSVYKAAESFAKKGVDVSELLPQYEVSLRKALAGSSLLNYANRTPEVQKFLATPIFSNISIDDISTLKFSVDFIKWKEQFISIVRQVDFLGKTIRNVDFLEYEVMSSLLSNYFGTIARIEEMVRKLDYSFYIQNIETLEYDPSTFLLVELYLLFGNQVYTAFVALEKFKVSDFKKSLERLGMESYGQYSLLKEVTDRFNSFHQLVQEQMVGLSSHPDLRSVIHGEHPLISRYLVLSKYVRFHLMLTEILARVNKHPSSSDRREIENLVQQIEGIVNKATYRSSDELTQLLDKKFRVLLLRTLILSNFALAIYYESSPDRLTSTNPKIWERFLEFPVDHLSFDILMSRPILYALLGTQLQKNEYLNHSIEFLKDLENVMNTAPPYLRLSYWFFRYMILLITQEVPYSEARNGIYQIFFEENLFIPNKELVNEFETYLFYLDSYEKAVEENTLKPTLPMEIQFRNLSLSEGNFFRHFKTLEAYWLTNKYIELQVPIYGSQSDSVYIKN